MIKEEDLVLIDKEFILEDFKEEEADIVYKVKIGDKDIIFYILLEMQSKVDFSMPIRLLMYMSELWRDELKNTAQIKKSVEIAKNLLDVLSDDVISKKTGLTIDIIKKLREDTEKENL